MFPTFAVDKVFQGVTQRLLECFLRMPLIRKRKGAKEIPISLQIDFLGQAHPTADGIGLFAFVMTLNVCFPLFFVRDNILHCLPHISFTLFFRKLLALPICVVAYAPAGSFPSGWRRNGSRQMRSWLLCTALFCPSYIFVRNSTCQSRRFSPTLGNLS